MIRSQTLLDNIYKKGFKRPSKIQAAALPIVLNMEKGKRNVIAQGQSGTGKTATYVLGMYNMVDPKVPQFKAICLEPTRELARQTFDVCQELSQGTGIKSKLIVTGTKSLLSLPIDDSFISFDHAFFLFPARRNELLEELVFVGTPGSMIKVIQMGNINPKNVLMLAVDEADMMLLDNLGEQTARIKEMLHPSAKVLLFSATFPDEVKEFADKIAPEATKITLKPSEVMLKRIMQLQCRTDETHDKYSLVKSVFSKMSIGQAIIFTNVCFFNRHNSSVVCISCVFE